MKFIQYMYVILGSVSLFLGILGIFLPLLPTTPFLLLSAFLYLRGSKRCYNWLINHKIFGPYILNYTEKKIIPLKTKIMALTIMWSSMSYCILFLVDSYMLKTVLFLIAVGITWHILSFKSRE